MKDRKDKEQGQGGQNKPEEENKFDDSKLKDFGTKFDNF